jgi:hypothetical protein
LLSRNLARYPQKMSGKNEDFEKQNTYSVYSVCTLYDYNDLNPGLHWICVTPLSKYILKLVTDEHYFVAITNKTLHRQICFRYLSKCIVQLKKIAGVLQTSLLVA